MEAVHLVDREGFGKLVVLKNNKLSSVPLEEVAGKLRLVTVDNDMIKTALSLGICLGNPEDVPFEKFYTEITTVNS